MKIALVVPTIRENCIRDFFNRWNNINLFKYVDLFIIEDNPKKTFTFLEIGNHYCWEDIENDFGEDSWIIPRRSDCVRSYGYWKAYELCYDFIMTLDDDCYPPSKDIDGLEYTDASEFINGHLVALNTRTKWQSSIPGVLPRGVPYLNRGQNKQILVNHGLWTNVPDYDGPRQLVAPSPIQLPFTNDVVPSSFYFPFCGMNWMAKREAIVLMYHLLMGQMVKMYNDNITVSDTQGVVLEKLPFDRFGDIWCGIFMKKIVDGAGYCVASGLPYIRHEKASNPFTNLKKEANGLEVNEKLWEYVDKFEYDGTSTVSGNYERLGTYIRTYKDFPEYNNYFDRLGKAMELWSYKFEG